MNSIAIWGAGPTGKKVYEKLKNKYNVICFIDNNSEVFGVNNDGIQVISPNACYEMLDNGSINKIILGTSANNYDDILCQVKKIKPTFENIYYVKEIGQNSELIKYTDKNLGYLEFDVARKCNLNCRGCLRYSNITEDINGYSIESFENDLKQLNTIFNNIAFIKILGGEPLLCKNLHLYLEIIFKYFPNTQVDILSNGILVNKMDAELISEVKKHSIRLSITIYKATEKYTEDIEKFCDNNGIEFNIYVNKQNFVKQLNIKGDTDGNIIVKNCMSKKCTIIKDGIINRCCQPTYTYELNKKFSTHFPEGLGINIYKAGISCEQIKDYIQNTEFCKYCTYPEEYVWSNGKKGIELSDWVVK